MFVKFDSKGHRGTSGSQKNHGIKNGTLNMPSRTGNTSSNKSPVSMRSILNDSPQSEIDLEPMNRKPPNFHNQSKTTLLSVTDNTDLTSVSQSTSSGRSSSKSKNGCLTCKYRKKKCDEMKPVCRDCRRFNKECVWIDHQTMNGAEIERLRARVKEQESTRKMRKRARLSNADLAERIAALSLPSLSPDLPLDPDGVSLHQNIQSYPNPYSPHPVSELRGSPVNMGSFLPPHTIPNGSYLVGPHSNHIDAVTKPESVAELNSVQAIPSNQIRPATEDPYSMFSGLPTHPSAHSPGPISQSLDDAAPFEHLVQPRSPAAVLGFLKELSLFNWNPQDQGQGRGQIEELAEGTNLDHQESPPILETGNSPGHVLPNSNIPTFIEQMQTMSHDFPAQFNNLASSFNATFSPSPRASLSFLPELDQSGLHLYNYYLDVLSRKVSIAPNSQNDSNSYQRVFLPLAQKDKGVLYGLLAWAGFHLGGQWLAEGTKYAELALKHLCEDISFSDGSQTIEDRRVIINKLAVILIMCGAEICRGDVKFWSIYLEWGWKLLRGNGGIMNFNNNKEEHWLISNFAYHDLLASSTSDRGTYFPNETYDQIFLDADGISSGNLNPLLGVSKPLYKIIGDISSLFFESKQIMNGYYRRSSGGVRVGEVPLGSPDDTGSVRSFTDSEVSDHSKVADMLNFIRNKAHDMEMVLENVKPNAIDLQNLSDSELELQLTTFEAFQLSCKLYLRQAILKLNPSALECQILMNDLTKCLDVLIDTPMQATLVFPTFIAGLFTVTETGKVAMRIRFEKLINDYGPWNVVRVKSLVEKIWAENPHGDRVVDWNAMLNNLNWDLNFA